MRLHQSPDVIVDTVAHVLAPSRAALVANEVTVGEISPCLLVGVAIHDYRNHRSR